MGFLEWRTSAVRSTPLSRQLLLECLSGLKRKGGGRGEGGECRARRERKKKKRGPQNVYEVGGAGLGPPVVPLFPDQQALSPAVGLSPWLWPLYLQQVGQGQALVTSTVFTTGRTGLGPCYCHCIYEW